MAFNKLSVISPLAMHKEDLLEQKQFLRQYLTDIGNNFTVMAMSGGQALSTHPFHSVDEMFNHEFPQSVDQLSIEAKEMNPDGTKITKKIKLLIDKKMADIQIYSEADGDWVSKTTKAVENFYSRKKTWYASLKGVLAPLSNVTMVAALFLATMAWQSDTKALVILPVLLVLYSVTMLILSLKGLIFPYSQINFFSKRAAKRPNYEFFTLIGWFTLLIASVTAIMLL